MEMNNFKAIVYLKGGRNIVFFGTMHECAEFADKMLTSYGEELTEVKIRIVGAKKEQDEPKGEGEQ